MEERSKEKEIDANKCMMRVILRIVGYRSYSARVIINM